MIDVELWSVVRVELSSRAITLSDAGTFEGWGDSPNGHRRFVFKRLSSGDVGGVLQSKLGSIWTNFSHKTQFFRNVISCHTQPKNLPVGNWDLLSPNLRAFIRLLKEARDFVCAKVYITLIRTNNELKFKRYVGCNDPLFSALDVFEATQFPFTWLKAWWRGLSRVVIPNWEEIFVGIRQETRGVTV